MMRFLVDTNLPPALADWLKSQGHEAEHSSAIGLASVSDRRIWDHALAVGASIVTKDEDFVLLKTNDPSGPQIVWIRVGNATRRVLLQKLDATWPAVSSALQRGEGIVEIR